MGSQQFGRIIEYTHFNKTKHTSKEHKLLTLKTLLILSAEIYQMKQQKNEYTIAN